MRWILALDDDHSDFLRAVRDDPMLGRASRALRGLRPLRVATVAQALLRAFCGQLIEAKRARRLEQTIIRTICAEGPERLHLAPTTTDLARARTVAAARARAARAAGAPRSSASAARSSSSGCTTSRPASSRRGSSASAASGRGRSASSASKGSAATTTGSSATSASSSSCARCAGGRSRAGRRRSCSSRTANGPASRACICSPAIRAVCSPRNLCAWSASRSSAAAASAKRCSRAC